MAEIRVEKKKPVWPWILLGLIILGIILYFVFAGDDNEVEEMEDTTTEQVQDTTYSSTQTQEDNSATASWEEATRDTRANNGEEVSQYIAHVGDQSRMGIEHEYTNDALIHLVEAVETKANELNVDINADLENIKRQAEQITQDPQATNHANKIKDAGTSIADALEKIQEEKFPDLSNEVSEVKSAAQEIDTTVLTLEQKDKINSFFNEAADVLKRMS